MKVFSALLDALGHSYTIATAGTVEGIEEPLIDHLVYSGQVLPHSLCGFSRFASNGERLSDHNGVMVELVFI